MPFSPSAWGVSSASQVVPNEGKGEKWISPGSRAGVCWAEVLVVLQHHQTGQQSPELCVHTAQTLLIPSQGSSWSCSCGSAGSVCGLGTAGAAGTPQSRAHKYSSTGWAALSSPGAALKAQSSSLLLLGPFRTGRTKESELRPLAKLALECHCCSSG